jgi:thiosulfate/3-mercaptopyruvate sulfurtransferase
MKTRILFACAVMAVWATAFNAQPARESLLVSPAQLAEQMKDPGLVVLHVGEQSAFEAEHIPAARLITLQEISTPPDSALSLQLPAVEKLQAAFEKKGISNDSRIVIYFEKDRIQQATRVFFTLDYLGLARQSSILDGGLAAWKAENRPVTSQVTEPAPGKLNVTADPGIVADIGYVSANLHNRDVLLLDARLPEFYDGTSAGRMPRAGHIPGAVNVPYTNTVDGATRLKDSAALEALFRAAGAGPGKSLVAYCHIGQQATALYFAARVAGLNVRLFDGSFEEWSRRNDLPVTTGRNP